MAISPEYPRTKSDSCFAKLVVALELRRTHGIVFAAAFLEEFDAEISSALDLIATTMVRER
jgi:hypothetical protein